MGRRTSRPEMLMRVRKQARAFQITAVIVGVLLMALTPTAIASQTQPAPSPQADTCTVDPDGTARITRVIPVPGTISPEAQKFISRAGPSGPEPTLAERRSHTDAFRIARATEARKLFPVNVEAKTIGGVQCDLITPRTVQNPQR